MPDLPVHIAGIGISPWSWPKTAFPSIKTRSAIQQLAISAGTKALLDAGLSYDNVDFAVGCGDLKGYCDVFYTFGQTGIPIHEADSESGLIAAIQYIKSNNAHCALVISLQQNAAVGIVLASDAFIWRHPYLKDSSVQIRGSAIGTTLKGSSIMKHVVQEALQMANIDPSDIQIVESDAESILVELYLLRNARTRSSTTNMSGLCELVWLLRGWTRNDSVSKTRTCLQCTSTSKGTATAFVLSRADGNPAPAFKEVEHKNDGRDRLGHNPALQTKEIALEDWEAVKSRAEFSDEKAANNVRFNRKGGDRAALAKI